MIRQIHADSRGVYGARRVHAEPTIGHGVMIGHQAVEMLMHRASLQGVSGRPSYRRILNMPTAGDLVDRQFRRTEPDRRLNTSLVTRDARLLRYGRQGHVGIVPC